MANVRLIVGVENVLRNMRRRQDLLGAGVSRGLRLAGLELQRASQLLVPVEYGVLRASAFTRHTGASFDTVVNVGYTAAYAIYVHENVAMAGRGLPRPSGRGNYWDPAGRGQAKFLEEPARIMTPHLRQTIMRAARI